MNITNKNKYNQKGGIYNANNTQSKQKKTDTGSGIILVEEYYDSKTRKYRPVIILFKNRFFGMFEDLGGGRDSSETLKESAIREAQEESRNLFILPEELLDDKKAVRIKNYVGYIVHIKGPDDRNINLKWYDYNKEIIDEHLDEVKPTKKEKSFDETIDITRIYVEQILKDGIFDIQGDFYTKNINNKTVKIFSRTKSLLRTAFINDLIDTDEYVELYECQYRGNKEMRFLNGTKGYH